ncbi:hypothetical protein N7G274_006640 [Stereocaulon virgatum]|uniref:Uncharacterized protein n=1 Tax=Stereocaulon virgatum TaxID=373712 RepID=A0ABR4A5N4_9LECA
MDIYSSASKKKNEHHSVFGSNDFVISGNQGEDISGLIISLLQVQKYGAPRRMPRPCILADMENRSMIQVLQYRTAFVPSTPSKQNASCLDAQCTGTRTMAAI